MRVALVISHSWELGCGSLALLRYFCSCDFISGNVYGILLALRHRAKKRCSFRGRQRHSSSKKGVQRRCRLTTKPRRLELAAVQPWSKQSSGRRIQVIEGMACVETASQVQVLMIVSASRPRNRRHFPLSKRADCWLAHGFSIKPRKHEDSFTHSNPRVRYASTSPR